MLSILTDSPHTSCFLFLTYKYVAVLLFSITVWMREDFQDAVRHSKNHKIKTHVRYDEYKRKVLVPVLCSLHV